ncbi:polysaccharide pyruvyl transferase family protein [Methylobacterium sp. Leaf91]|uniref:polysaccharide pyruvyl transferase family protein n=1 Tax=Methylobacterium sp. Leaf91 TaxID=1736247 RepID=UPI0006F9C6E8|nr:polysaccharide pyruvyl transferase family protein [Methylobacterium sp. Leaf91]KQO91410.1 hypothetical protein ASF32_22650 [Methylobacterium sp. Leaf91]
MRNVVIASGDLNNIGDFALLMQCVEGLRRLGLTNPMLVRQWVMPPPGILQELRDADIGVLSGKDIPGSLAAARGGLVVVGGGQMVRDNASTSSLALLAAMMETARRTGGMSAVLGCGVSRLTRMPHRMLWRRMLSSASVLTVRDDASLAEVEGLCGRAAKPVLTADLAFCPTTLHAALARSTGAGPIIVAPCDDASEDRCIDIAALARLSISAAHAFDASGISLVAHDSAPRMDPVVCQALDREIRSRAPAITVNHVASNALADYMNAYAGASLVVTNRLHATIFGLLARKPILIVDDGGTKTMAAARQFDIATVKLASAESAGLFDRLLVDNADGPPERRGRNIEAAGIASASNFDLLNAALEARA